MKRSFGVCLAGVLLFWSIPWSGAGAAQSAEHGAFTQCPPISGIKSVGSAVLTPLMQRWAQVLEQRVPELSIRLDMRGSRAAIIKLLKCQANVGPMSERPEPDEIARFVAARGYRPTVIPVAADAVVLLVHEENTADGTTLAELDAIFSRDRRCKHFSDIRTWGDFDPQYPSDQPIRLYGPDRFSATYGYFQEAALCKGEPKESIRVMPSSKAVAEAVRADRFGMGYASLSVVDESAMGVGVRPLQLAVAHGEPRVAPTRENVLNGRYPLARPLFLVVNRAPGGTFEHAVSRLLDLVFSEEGQRIAAEEGYIRVPPEEVREVRQMLGFPAEP